MAEPPQDTNNHGGMPSSAEDRPEGLPGFLPKAYNNHEFLHSPHARTIRLLAEYLEPQARLRQYKVRGTIVMFGSARARSPEELDSEMKLARAQIEQATPAEQVRIRNRISGMERLSRYYADASQLSYNLTKYFQALPDMRDRHIICSGGGPGIMEAANRGAAEAGGRTVGLSISLPHEQGNNRYLDPAADLRVPLLLHAQVLVYVSGASADCLPRRLRDDGRAV